MSSKYLLSLLCSCTNTLTSSWTNLRPAARALWAWLARDAELSSFNALSPVTTTKYHHNAMLFYDIIKEQKLLSKSTQAACVTISSDMLIDKSHRYT